MEAREIPSSLAASLASGWYREALDMAMEFDSIRSIYGEECCSFVQRSLTTSIDPNWRRVVERSVQQWSASSGRRLLDLGL